MKDIELQIYTIKLSTQTDKIPICHYRGQLLIFNNTFKYNVEINKFELLIVVFESNSIAVEIYFIYC